MRSSVKYVALFCLVLTLWSALAFAAHHHTNGADSAKCTVCVAAHSAAPKATASLLQANFTPVSICLPEAIFRNSAVRGLRAQRSSTSRDLALQKIDPSF